MTATLKWPGHLGKMALILCDLSPAERCPGGQGYLLFQVCVHISSLSAAGYCVSTLQREGLEGVCGPGTASCQLPNSECQCAELRPRAGPGWI